MATVGWTGYNADAQWRANWEMIVAYIDYAAEEDIGPENQVPDRDNILRIHGIHSNVMRRHFDLYRELMFTPGPISRKQREMIAVVVSATNGCHY
jgi:alkylhydroperoxidase family enzyme